MSLKELPINNRYRGRPKFFTEIVDPALEQGLVRFDVSTAYFNSSSLGVISRGLDAFFGKDCNMRLVISEENPDLQLMEAAQTDWIADEQVAKFDKKLIQDASLITDEIDRSRVALLAYLMQKEILQVKVGVWEYGRFHDKTYILEDSENNLLVATGSANATRSGFTENYESIKVFTSWGEGRGWLEGEGSDVEEFENIWNNRVEGLTVKDLDKEVANEILEALGNPSEDESLNIVKNYENKEVRENKFHKELLKSPIYNEFNLSNSGLYPHQINSIKKPLKMWPIRMLFADEVGLGKTLELGFMIKYLIKHQMVERVLILCPAQLTEQWQEEMKLHFDLSFARYERGAREWVYLDDEESSIKQDSELLYSEEFPKYAILSKSMAIKGMEKNIFSNSSIFPDFLVLDEAHHARQHRNERNRKIENTILRRVLNNNKQRFKHVAFATATPLRKHPDEYYFLLELLGLDLLMSEEEYADSLRYIEEFQSSPETFQLNQLRQITSTLKKIADVSDKNLIPLNHLSNGVFEEIRKGSANEGENQWIFDNKNDLLVSYLLWHPARLLTTRNIQANLKKFPDIYQIPERDIKATPIDTNYMGVNLTKFFDLLMDYVENDYYQVEMCLDPERSLPIGLRKAQIKERFSSSFWAARKSVYSRKEKLQELLVIYKENSDTTFSIDRLLEINDDDFYKDELEVLYEEKERIVGEYGDKDIDWERLVDVAEREIRSLEFIYNWSEKIIRETDTGRDADPKINILLELIEKHFKSQPGKPILIFSKYTDTLDKVVEATVSFLEELFDKKMGYAIYTGKNKSVKLFGYQKEFPATKTEITDHLKKGSIQVVFCSSAAGEGLNLQEASTLINVDVPWVAADLEQRIGRVARLGQKEEKVIIENIWYPNLEEEMYKRLLIRANIGSFAVGDYPPLIPTDVADEVEGTGFDSGFDANIIDEINKIKNSDEYKSLEQLWNIEGVTKDAWGNVFRNEILKVLRKRDIDLGEISYKAGETNILSLNSPELDAIFSEVPISVPDTNAELHYLKSNGLLWGFCYSLDKNENEKYIINPQDLSSIISCLYFEETLENTGKEFKECTLQELLNLYLEEGYPVVLPLHYCLQLDIDGLNVDLPYKYSEKIETVLVGKIKVQES